MADPQQTAIAAFDLGGTDLKAARIARDGSVHRFIRVPSRASEGEAALFEAIATAAARLDVANGPEIVGLGSPGVIHPVTGAIVDRTPNMKLPADFPMRDALERALGRRVVVDNDANCAALAEHHAGAARGASVSITITLGTGVGSGIVVEGRVLRGAFGGAGEVGHLPVGSDGPPCPCSVVGCAEPVASGAGLLRRAREARLDVETARDVFESRDPRAAALIARMVDHLARILGAATQVLNPNIIVVGGGVAQAGEKLFVPLRASVAKYTLASHHNSLRIVPAALGEQAGAIGAGLLAWQALTDVPAARRA
jgi:glucokinase